MVHASASCAHEPLHTPLWGDWPLTALCRCHSSGSRSPGSGSGHPFLFPSHLSIAFTARYAGRGYSVGSSNAARSSRIAGA